MLAVAPFPLKKIRVAPSAAMDVRISYPESLQDGDLIFRRGRDVLSALVLAQSQGSSYSHVGMLVRTEGAWSVLHSTPATPGEKGGVHMEPLDSFASPAIAAKAAFFRVEGLTSGMRSKAREYLMRQVDKPFDYRFEYSDDSSHYCTELVLKALRYAGIGLVSSKDHVQVITLSEAVIPPDSLLVSPRLRELTPDSKTQISGAEGHGKAKASTLF